MFDRKFGFVSVGWKVRRLFIASKVFFRSCFINSFILLCIILFVAGDCSVAHQTFCKT